VPAPGAPSATELRAQLGRRLPAYMIPSQVVMLPALPLSSNGKIDRNALARPEAHAAPRGPQPDAVPTDFVAPRTDLERRLAQLWEQLLQRPVGVTDDFFAVGGHSLLAVMLVARIKAELGAEVPLSRLLQRPTIEALAVSLHAKERAGDAAATAVPARPGRHLVTLQAGGSRPPLVMLPGIGGYAFMYRDFPRLFGADQPVLALQLVGMEADGSLGEHSIEEMAEIYEQEVLAAVPDGPLVLGGYSFGALPAFELARRLRRRGREVPLLVSLDGFAPGFPRLLPLPERALAHLREALSGDLAHKRAYLASRAARVRAAVLRRLGRGAELAPDLPCAAPAMNQQMKELWVRHTGARDRYHPNDQESFAPEPCALLLVTPESTERWLATQMDDALLGWRSMVSGPITAMTVPGHHTVLLQSENQPRIVAAIAEQIDRLVREPATARA